MDIYEQRRLAWADDLDANADKQGSGLLHPAEDEFCCLGRACVISDISEWDSYAYDGEDTVLPGSVMQWLGLGSDNGDLHYPIPCNETNEFDGHWSLVTLNDCVSTGVHNHDFHAIASVIRDGNLYLKGE